MLFVYGPRDCGETPNKNVLRPQDVMRLLVHYHAYGDPGAAEVMIDAEAERLAEETDRSEAEDVARIKATHEQEMSGPKAPRGKSAEKKRAERDAAVADRRRRAEDERRAVAATGEELRKLYAEPDELARHARVVDLAEVAENEWNLNVPRYVDTFEPEEPIDPAEALRDLNDAEDKRRQADQELRRLLKGIGFGG